ncbi:MULTISPECIES: lyase family protein [unclassified Rhizobacter]|uniref:class II fumarate hydratase n=1 Tax=unclassified Rhizobacter TaxID=2640088 RepID=UPI0006FE882D|nr:MULTISPECIES: class II fumarate hydratase [unclassified Rhizobacter]KQU65989.1 aspartate ammonia-lyase [Rhizobacter sp. Root29]KQV97870.1 aspartate ammonia-lyase [Rhizobacter sp. Root1238]KRB18743.1 aspartate ammonia-lyase [Rhizobacter sp. Root16D2]
MPATRLEHDSLGDIAVPADALYGAQTQRAVLNFPVSGGRLPAAFIRALIQLKLAAARANARLGTVEPDTAQAIEAACRELLDSDFMQHFPLDVFQTGSGTSSNMNANEVIATLATRRLGRPVSANDHVNHGQSSNDVIPSAIHLSAGVVLAEQLLPALHHLSKVTRDKARSVHQHVKTGRTHLMDAMPVRLSQALGGWASQVDAQIARLEALRADLAQLALGGTAVGTGVNAHPDFARLACEELTGLVRQVFRPGDDYFALMGAQDTALAVSGQLKGLAASLMKIANDLRWMNSGPLAGLGEIELEALQPGSSIMPGKVNPVIPEATTMVAAQVIGNDTAITIAGQSGNFELNVMLPLVARNLVESLELLANVSRLLADKAIAGFTVRGDRLRDALSRNPILVTALNPLIGYARAAEIAKQAYREGRPIIDVADEQTTLGRAELERLLDPSRLADGEGEGGGGG